MITVNFTEFRQRARSYFQAAQEGEKVRVLSHGKPIGDIISPEEPKKVPSWKQPRRRFLLRGVSLTEEVLKERRESKW
jgi:antitoxin (DNA-binding transcriptional repressor) of toxin-antitoxin stability system